ncbi:hypothetical protein HC141_03050 [Lactobacillus mulieris]|nr:hypothetical protein [Lactobacillus mulieris]MDK6563798.1 hypothetical protein [Lactobacillus mulieris]MDK8082862.1 hypothetical protein [Lactobacillus mulieris]NKC42919.1 hypothetical protein [Lactobacillus mulieris]
MNKASKTTCLLCGRDLTNAESIYADINHRIFCNAECSAKWHILND